MKYKWNVMTDEERRWAVAEEMRLVTHNGTTKEDFMEIMRFQVAELAQTRARCEAAEEDIKSMATNRILGFCTFCKHRDKPDLRYMPCKKCERPNGSHTAFEWRGPQGQEGAGE